MGLHKLISDTVMPLRAECLHVYSWHNFVYLDIPSDSLEDRLHLRGGRWRTGEIEGGSEASLMDRTSVESCPSMLTAKNIKKPHIAPIGH